MNVQAHIVGTGNLKNANASQSGERRMAKRQYNKDGNRLNGNRSKKRKHGESQKNPRKAHYEEKKMMAMMMTPYHWELLI